MLPLDDTLGDIFASLRLAALIQQVGAGTGFSFSGLRPRGGRVEGAWAASGPVSFLRLFDTASAVVREGGRRRGANMAVLDVSHPDIEAFVDAKRGAGVLESFNLSVGVSDAFMRAVVDGTDYALVDPRSGHAVRRLAARTLFDRIADAAWTGGDPGLLFLDAINRANPTPWKGRIEATNPCGEVPLLPNESCTLGSLNLPRFVEDGRVDWERLGAAVRVAVRFLDDVIDVNAYPASELAAAARATRKIGVGFMGLAELLLLLGIRYGTAEAAHVAGKVAGFINEHATRASVQLAEAAAPIPASDWPRPRRGRSATPSGPRSRPPERSRSSPARRRASNHCSRQRTCVACWDVSSSKCIPCSHVWPASVASRGTNSTPRLPRRAS